ncbi:MAG: lipopolysaccharide biosynthesis protein [Hyphomicrobiales bacterium]
MLKSIFGTTGIKLLGVVINLIIISISTSNLGATNYGIITLFIFGISLFHLSCEALAGSSTLYYASRLSIWEIFFPAWSWILLIALVSFPFLHLLSLFPSIYSATIQIGTEYLIVITGIFLALSGINTNYLIGIKKIKAVNLIFLAQILSNLAFLCIFIYILDIKDYAAGIYSASLSYVVSFILSAIVILPRLLSEKIKQPFSKFKVLLSYGYKTQIGSYILFGNKKITIPLIKSFIGDGPLGVYNAGIKITEGFRIISQSVALVQFSEIANSNDSEYSKNITLSLIKGTTIITLLGILVLVCIPMEFFSYFLGKDFSEVKPIIYCLSPGVILFGANIIFSHYFSGTNRPIMNSVSNFIGLISTIIFCYLLLPSFGLIGAGIATSFGYIVSAIFQLIIFIKISKAKIHELIITKKDYVLFRGYIKDFLKQYKKKSTTAK